VAAAVWWGYPLYQAWRWEQELTSTDDFDNVRDTLYEMIHSNNRWAKEVLERRSAESDLIAYDPQHNTMLVIDAETHQPHRFFPTYSSHHSNLTARYMDARLVESHDEGSVFAATNQRDESVTLFVMADLRTFEVGPITVEEFEEWKSAGLWEAIKEQHGTPWRSF